MKGFKSSREKQASCNGFLIIALFLSNENWNKQFISLVTERRILCAILWVYKSKSVVLFAMAEPM